MPAWTILFLLLAGCASTSGRTPDYEERLEPLQFTRAPIIHVFNGGDSQEDGTVAFAVFSVLRAKGFVAKYEEEIPPSEECPVGELIVRSIAPNTIVTAFQVSFFQDGITRSRTPINLDIWADGTSFTQSATWLAAIGGIGWGSILATLPCGS